MSTEITHKTSGDEDVPAALLEKVLLSGDLAQLTPADRLGYYQHICRSLGLNPLTRPFEYLKLSGKLVLYARRDAADQLRKIHGISITRVDVSYQDDLVVVTVDARDRAGRTDTDVGAVGLGGKRGDERANMILRAVCVPLDSEILTREGFKTYDTLVEGEEVLAYDTSTDHTVWTPLRAVTVHQSLPMARLRSTGGLFDVRCTPDHTWAVRRNLPYRPNKSGDGSRGPRGPYKSRGAQRTLVQAQRLLTHHALILAAPERGASEDESLLRPVEAAVLAWAVTDGTIQRRGTYARLGICQSKEVNFAAIRELVAAVAPGVPELVSAPRRRTFPSSGMTYDTLAQHWWYIPAAVTRAILGRADYHDRSDLPRLVTRLSCAARRAMLQAFMLAEGDARGVFCNTDRHVLDAFAILSALEGHPTGQEHPRASIVYQRLTKARHVRACNLHLEHVEAQPAWCATTDYGTWVMRQNGRVMITGNTKAKRRVTLSICGLGMLDETEVETIPDAQHETLDAEPVLHAGAHAGAGGAEKAQETARAQNEESFTRRAAAALGASGARTDGKAEQVSRQRADPDADLRAEVLHLLTDDPEALDAFQGSGRRLEEMGAAHLRGWRARLLERARKRADDMPRSSVLSQQIAGARSDSDLGAARRAVQDARNAREITEAEWLSLMSEAETRKSALAGPLTALAGAQP